MCIIYYEGEKRYVEVRHAAGPISLVQSGPSCEGYLIIAEVYGIILDLSLSLQQADTPNSLAQGMTDGNCSLPSTVHSQFIYRSLTRQTITAYCPPCEEWVCGTSQFPYLGSNEPFADSSSPCREHVS